MASLNILRRNDAPPSQEAGADVRQFLTFQMAGETFAIGILRIREILEYVRPTVVPLMPAFIRGVMNLRGAVVPVIDLALRFARDETLVHRRTCIVIIEIEHEEQCQLIGILVDAVHEVLAIPDSEIEPPPQFGNQIRADFIEGMAKIDNGFVILLNVDKVLSMNEISLLTELSRQHEIEEPQW
ncbi:chemotaxis protein CheW [Chromobacterium sp. IIBBL 290-4]|uniref:chemotaxis protein CheW n=1 Tax=Chromobacterium sp. IIBBL 290-4 TaxID=2953890 RepID=UPI0020B82E94|nr:chemotaxis protein CheW [Chromobacterium sp. IIBBL 290-4]UTH75048.1 chemotaxis protein CheW [Chromobacterium sp. IIBBL 290-4]